jgi:hypothetical protein
MQEFAHTVSQDGTTNIFARNVGFRRAGCRSSQWKFYALIAIYTDLFMPLVKHC